MITINGEGWHKYAIEYESDGKTYRAEIWARSLGEAQVMLSDLKESGQIVGKIVGQYQSDQPIDG